MSIMELGAMGEFVGAIAVVATLIYLAIQVRQSKQATQENSRLARAAVSAQTYEIFAEHRRHIIDNADVAKIWQDLGRAAGYDRVVAGMPRALAGIMHDGPGMRTIWERVREWVTSGGDSSFADAVETAAEEFTAQSQETRR